MQAVSEVIDGSVVTKPIRTQVPAEVDAALAELVPMIEDVAPGLPNARWVAFRLLDGDLRIREALLNGDLAHLPQDQQRPATTAAPSLVSIHGAQ